jgi:hypothetical protein
MSSRYSVIQYVPDTIADERINIGVVAYGGGAIFVRSLQDWQRVRNFVGHDPGLLRDFLFRLQEPARGGHADAPLTVEQIETMASEWTESIQLTPPRASLKAPHELIGDLVRMFLRHPEEKGVSYRTHQDAVILLRTQVRNVLRNSLAPGADEKLVRPSRQVDGRREPHELDIVVGDGAPYFGAQALSFEMARSGPISRAIDATAYKLIDIKQLNPDFPVALLALPPRKGDKTTDQYERAQRIFETVDTPVLTELELPDWAASQASKMKAEVVA